MGVFVIFSSLEKEPELAAIGSTIAQKIAPNELCQADARTWFISTNLATPKDVFEYISLTGTEFLLVMPVTAYWGIHKKHVWDWLSAKGI